MTVVAPPPSTHGHGHGHGRAPEAPAGVMAYLNGEPVPRSLLDERLAALRAGDAACVLPRADSREGRQLARWVAQLVLVEQVCADELRRRDDAVQSGPGKVLDVSTAIAVGSITAAALAGSEPVRRVAALVSSEVRIPRAQLEYAAGMLGERLPADPDVPTDRWHAELLDSARLEAFGRWLNAALHERVQLVRGLEHPGDSSQPDNLHRH